MTRAELWPYASCLFDAVLSLFFLFSFSEALAVARSVVGFVKFAEVVSYFVSFLTLLFFQPLLSSAAVCFLALFLPLA